MRLPREVTPTPVHPSVVSPGSAVLAPDGGVVELLAATPAGWWVLDPDAGDVFAMPVPVVCLVVDMTSAAMSAVMSTFGPDVAPVEPAARWVVSGRPARR